MEEVLKALMKTPINGARLSSPFGMRKHPIDGFNKMHRGTDFAAPTGTPIMASGSGIVKKQDGVVEVGTVLWSNTTQRIKQFMLICQNLPKELKEELE